MIIACPACGTKYVVPDNALGVDGRTVRCAKCKHSWFQDGPAADLPPRDGDAPLADTAQASVPPTAQTGQAPATPADKPQHVPVEKPEEISAAATVTAGEHATAAPAPATSQGDDRTVPLPDAATVPPPFYRVSDQVPASSRKGRNDTVAPSNADDGEPGYSSFDYRPPFRPRRNRLRLFTFAAGGFAALALLAIVALQLWGLPAWFPGAKPLFAGEEEGLVMSFPEEENLTRTLPNGGEFLAISGTITNTGRETRSVPPILLVLRDGRDRVVYSQEIAPPLPELAPGETREVNEAIADVPRSAAYAEFGWAPR